MAESTTTKQPQVYRTNEHSRAGELQPSVDVLDYMKEYAREKPEVAAMWCLGIGFVLGWKLKPW